MHKSIVSAEKKVTFQVALDQTQLISLHENLGQKLKNSSGTSLKRLIKE